MQNLHLCFDRYLPLNEVNDWALRDVCFAMGATQCIVRFIYWFQLNEKIGPIVMNISRVFLDIMSFTSIYTLIVSAFTSGLVFVLTSDHFYHFNNGTYIEINTKVNGYAYE